jgi:hypothetical protein
MYLDIRADRYTCDSLEGICYGASIRDLGYMAEMLLARCGSIGLGSLNTFSMPILSI